jgi:hypothetical protein
LNSPYTLLLGGCNYYYTRDPWLSQGLTVDEKSAHLRSTGLVTQSAPEFSSLEQFTRGYTVSKNDHYLKLIKYIFLNKKHQVSGRIFYFTEAESKERHGVWKLTITSPYVDSE